MNTPHFNRVIPIRPYSDEVNDHNAQMREAVFEMLQQGGMMLEEGTSANADDLAVLSRLAEYDGQSLLIPFNAQQVHEEGEMVDGVDALRMIEHHMGHRFPLIKQCPVIMPVSTHSIGATIKINELDKRNKLRLIHVPKAEMLQDPAIAALEVKRIREKIDALMQALTE